jgi:hypothetical protein
MSYIQFIVQTERPDTDRDNTWRATAHRTDSARDQREYRGQGSSEHEAAEDAIGQLLRQHMSPARFR